MKAVVLEEFGAPLVIKDVPQPEPGFGEVLVKVRACAADMFDIKIISGKVPRAKPPVVLGHEVAGEIASLGPGVEGWKVGQRVTCSLYLSCGRCRFCATGRETLCDGSMHYLGVDTDGGYAEYTVLPAHVLVELPETIPWAQGAILANALGTAYHAFTKRMRLMPSERVIITGAGGGVGLHAVQLARAMGALVMAVDIGRAKLDAASKFGAEVVVDASQEDFAQVAMNWSGGKGVEGVLELVGAATIASSLSALGKGGRLVIVGFHKGGEFPIQASRMVANEWEILGSRNVGKQELVDVVRLVEAGRIQPVVTEVHPLEELEKILERLENLDVVGRAVLEI